MSSPSKRLAVFFGAALIASLVSVPLANAAPITPFSATVSGRAGESSGVSDYNDTVQDATNASASDIYTKPNGSSTGSATAQSFAEASTAGLRASSRATIINNDPLTGLATAEATAMLQLPLTISGAGGSGTLVPLTISNLRLDGTFATNPLHIESPGSISTEATVGIRESVSVQSFSGQLVEFGSASGAYDQNDVIGLPFGGDPQEHKSASRSGTLIPPLAESDPFGTPIQLQDATFLIPLFRSFVLTINLFADTFTSSNTVSSSGDALSDFSHTLLFPRTAPLFILPSGYSITSETGLVADNRLVAPDAPSPVPAPSSVLLLLAGLAGSVARGLKRCGSRKFHGA